MKSQHQFVSECIARHSEEGAHPQDGDIWEEAHFPFPRDCGDQTIALRFWEHQVQGILQSEEMGRVCFFAGDAKRFFSSGPFVEDWFELYDLFEKWMKLGAKESHRKIHGPKNSEGKSVVAVKAAIASHAKKDRLGKSINGKRASTAAHSKKNASGKSVTAVKAGKASAKTGKNCRKVKVVCLESGKEFSFDSQKDTAKFLRISEGGLSMILNGTRSKPGFKIYKG